MISVVLPGWTVLGLIAVILWVLGSFFDKFLLSKYFGDDEGGPGALLIFSSYFSIFSVFFIFFIGYKQISFDLMSGLFGILIGNLNGVWILLYLHALHRSEVSRVIPFFQTIPIFGLVFSFFFLGETLSIQQVVAAFVIICGAMVLLYDNKYSFLRIDVRTLVLMLGAAMFVALTETLFKVVSLDTNYWTAAFWTFSGFALFGIVIYIFVSSYRDEFRHMISSRIGRVFSTNSVNEVFDSLAELVFFAAVVIGPVALVQSLNAYQPVLALMAVVIFSQFASKFFAEDISRTTLLQKFFGILIITFASIYLYTLI